MKNAACAAIIGMNMKRYLCVLMTALFSSCATAPSGVKPVSGFELERYLGTWHEIARLDHSFERGLVRVSAEYSMLPAGGVRVVNRGFEPAKNKWRQAVGRAYFTGDSSIGSLRVSFFRPFYGGYNIIELDPAYRYALVAGPNRSYLWILAREPELPAEIVQKLISTAQRLGFETGKLIFPGKTVLQEGI